MYLKIKKKKNKALFKCALPLLKSLKLGVLEQKLLGKAKNVEWEPCFISIFSGVSNLTGNNEACIELWVFGFEKCLGILLCLIRFFSKIFQKYQEKGRNIL